MSEITTVPLDGLRSAKGIEFVKAQWWDISSRFVIVFVRTAEAGEKPLRMDMNKRAILDYIGDEYLDGCIRAKSIEIWSVIASAMRESVAAAVV